MTSPTKTRIKAQVRADGKTVYTAQYQSAWNLFLWKDIEDEWISGTYDLDEAKEEIDAYLGRERSWTNVGKPTFIKYP